MPLSSSSYHFDSSCFPLSSQFETSSTLCGVGSPASASAMLFDLACLSHGMIVAPVVGKGSCRLRFFVEPVLTLAKGSG
jgi:hypothetical protein